MYNIMMPVLEWMPTEKAAASHFDPQPAYATDGSGAFDLRAFEIEYNAQLWNINQGAIRIRDNSLIKIHTGLRLWIGQPIAQERVEINTPGSTEGMFWKNLALPFKYLGIVTVRSSLGRDGLRLLNSVAYIDSDYQGEIVLMAQHMRSAETDLNIRLGDRVAQLAIVPVITPSFVKVNQFSSTTDRGSGGFGSTGK